MKITKEQIQEAYRVAVEVYQSRRTPSSGAEYLHTSQGLNINSARDYITGFNYMMSGQKFTRTLSAPAVDFFFSKIEDEFGLGSLVSAVSAVRKHIEYYESLRNTNLKKLRAVVDSYEVRIDPKSDLGELLIQFSEQVKKAVSDGPEKRQKRMSVAAPKPKTTTVTTTVYIRNPDVVAEVLERANGVCERCDNAAPFRRKSDGSPYLEVHHMKRLADGGDDTVNNAIALCPNCHRKLHHGT